MASAAGRRLLADGRRDGRRDATVAEEARLGDVTGRNRIDRCIARPEFAPERDGAPFAAGLRLRVLVTACAQAGFAPRVVQQSRQMQTTAGLVAGGIGVARMPRLFGPMQPQDITLCELTGTCSPLAHVLAIAYRTPSPLVDALRESARNAVHKLGLVAAT